MICPVLVGRDAAIDIMRTVLSHARDNRGGILLIGGEAGIGKSRLLRETAAEARQQGFALFRGACFEADRSTPYAPLLDLIREYSVTSSRTAVAHAFAPAATELVRTFPELASIFTDASATGSSDSQLERRSLFHALAETIATVASTQPVLLSIEDVHWGDEASLDLLLHLARRLATQSVVIALSFRSDEISPPLAKLLAELDRTRIATEINLNRFSASEFSSMLSAIFDGAPPGGNFVETMYETTEGNPFFVEEVLKSLVNTGELARRADGAWHARTIARVRAPRTAVEAVRRRLSALSVPARDIASMAAVVGRRFDFDLLQTLSGHNERALLALFRELIDAQLVVEETPERFAFRHALTREALVGELLQRERAALHRAVADALGRQEGDSNQHIEALAYHAYGATDWPRALDACSRAALHALGLHAPREALANLDRALEAAKNADITPGIALRFARGRALETLGEFDAAHDEFIATLSAARATGEPKDTWNALHALGMLWSARDYGKVGEYRREALALARSIGDELLMAHSLNRVANWHTNLDQVAPARRFHEEALGLFERLGDASGIAETVDLLAMTHALAGDATESVRYYERAVTLYELHGEKRGLASALAVLCLLNGSTHASCTAFARNTLGLEESVGARAVRLARDIGWRAGQAFALYCTGDALGWAGMYDRAIPLVRESLALAEEIDHLQWQAGAARALGMILLDLHALPAARTQLERAHAIALRLGSRTWIRWCAAPLAIAMARAGEFAVAEDVLSDAAAPSPLGREALQEGDESSPTLGERFLALARAELALQQGDAQRALSIANVRLAAERGPVLRLMLIRAQGLMAIDEIDEARRALDDAQAVAIGQNAQPQLFRILLTKAALLRKLRRHADARRVLSEARSIALTMAAKIVDDEYRTAFERAIQELAPELSAPTALQKAKASSGGLTARERDVAKLIAQGKANRVIGRTLGIGERTVEGHVAAALAKLGFSARAQLATWWTEQGLNAAAKYR
ncbi:MAG: AAA family ATPase [Gemmatimonadaceae bacterium]